jgi:hypothetical protein
VLELDLKVIQPIASRCTKYATVARRMKQCRNHIVPYYRTKTPNNLKHLSSREPTYWPYDRNKLPDLMDFCVTKGIPQDFATVKSCFDLSSDHSLELVALTRHMKNQEKQPCLNTDIQTGMTSDTSSMRN